MLTEWYKQLKNCTMLSTEKRHGMEKATMESLKELSSMYLKMAKQSNTTSWEEEACDETTNPPKLKPPKVTFRKEVTVIPTSSDQQEPKRAVKEVVNLKSSQIVSNDGPPARNTRSRFVAASAAALAAMASVTQADGHQWEHRNHTIMPNKLELNEIANAVLEGDKVLKYRQLIQHPVIGEQWRHSSANEFGRLAQGIGGRVKGTDTVKFIPKHQVPDERMKYVTYGQFVCNVRPEKEEKNRTRVVKRAAAIPAVAPI